MRDHEVSLGWTSHVRLRGWNPNQACRVLWGVFSVRDLRYLGISRAIQNYRGILGFRAWGSNAVPNS